MKNFLFVSLFLLSMSFYGQEKPVKRNVCDTTYIKDLTDKMMLGLFISNKTDVYYTFGKDPSKTLALYPNVPSKISLSFDYQIVSLALSLPTEWSLFKAGDEKMKGKTTSISFTFGFSLKKWFQNFYYNDTQGYYINNTGSLDPTWVQGVDPYLQLPNLRTKKIEGTTSYVINGNKYSHRAFLYQNQIQKISAGSFIPSLSYSYLNLSNMDSEAYSTYEEDVFSLHALLGYQYNWAVSKRFCVSGGGNLGLGFRNSHKYFNNDGVAGDGVFTSLSNSLQLNLSLSYQTPKIYYGLKAIITGTTAKQDQISNINNSVGYGTLYLGYRFDAPRIVSKNYNKLIGSGAVSP